ncbi:hypothetical protein Bca4012_067772 [Brassica carinata]|uniref:Uncharacterized protein n=1 Tax=Brassica carinata TaxID=52824 RepID=A0A8X8AZ56_BRACI|nr:hypothetical protein Bca52824_019992 [Brassica carinata]
MWGSYCCQETARSMNSYFDLSHVNSVKQTVHLLLLISISLRRVRRESAAVTQPKPKKTSLATSLSLTPRAMPYAASVKVEPAKTSAASKPQHC